jgi:predicted AlkP superfamily phosphohydrolase/phosphomutase/Flp pilus assembly protein TadD
MPRRRLLHISLILLALTALLYVAISLYLPSPRRLIFGVDKSTGKVRKAESGIAFLPPHQFYRLSFERREGAAQRDGLVRIRSREGIPVRVFYRLRFGVQDDRLPDPRRLTREGWTAWMGARVGEAVSAVASQFPVEQISSPASEFSRQRERLRSVVTRHLARSGLQVSAFEIYRIEVDRDALLEYKRAELRRNARGSLGNVAVFAIDGADWELIQELIIDGRLPNIKAMVDGGVTGSVQTIQPTISSLLWTTVATGVSPDRHGIVDFFDARHQQSPVSSLSRRAPALWEIAELFNRDAAAVNWWTNWPPQHDTGVVFDSPVQLLPNGYHPPDLAPLVSRSVLPVETVEFRQISRFLNITPVEFERAVANPADPASLFRYVLAKTWSDHRSGMEIYRARRPMLFMLHFEGADVVNHLFAPYHPPFREGVTQEGYRKYWPTVAAYYSELDRMIGEWMRALSEDTTLMLVSAHGFHWGENRPRRPPGGESALSAHRAPGFFVAYGNRIAPSRARRPLSIYDVAPTVLALLGLPPAQEMQGQLASWAFDGVSPVQGVNIVSYRDLVADRTLGASVAVDPRIYRTRLQQIGHVADTSKVMMPVVEGSTSSTLTPEQWGLYAYHNNRGAQLKQQGKLAEAAEAFAEAIRLNPSRPIAYLNLSIVLFDRQQYTAAEDVFLEAVKRGLPNPEQYIVDFATLYRERNMLTRAISLLSKGRDLFPQSYLIASNLGSALAAVDRYTEALPELERALGLRPTSTTVLNNMGTYYLRRKDLGRALDYWNRSLAIDPRQSDIREAVAAVQTRL